MINKKKVCVYLVLMLLGVCNISTSRVYGEEVKTEDQEVTVETQESVKSNKDNLELASEFMAKKDYASAIVYLTNFISSKPKKYEAYKMRGDCFYALRQYKLAQNDYQKAIELKASDDKFITGTKVLGALVLGADKDEQLQNPELGNLYGKLMYAQKALNTTSYESSYQKAFEYNSHIYLPKPKKEDIAKINCPQKYGKLLDPKGVDKYIYGAIDDIENGAYSEAIYKTQYVTSNYPKYYLGYYLTGVALAGMDKEAPAISAFETALKYNPYDFESLASLGQIYYQEAEKTFSAEAAQKSIEYFEKALQYNSNCYIYYYYIGLNQLQIGDCELAIKNFNMAIKYKPNDYNSMYYKLIAQYIQGDYSDVSAGATRLLYRHVSNYNSVLYLRALAQYKLGYFDDALADIEKIHNNMNDIYNADVKKLTPKEKTLESYLYYLKAQIIQQKGLGVKSDMQKAMQNPIIANLSKVDRAVKQYTKALDDSDISPEDYNKYKKFYDTQIQSLFNPNLVITVEDIDNQYDYIRTTFDNLGVTFVYKEPNYKLTTIKDYAYKKYGSKLSGEDEDVNSSTLSSDENVELRQSTDPSETLAGDKSSIAQMLAAQSFVAAQTSDSSDENFESTSYDKKESKNIVADSEQKTVDVLNNGVQAENVSQDKIAEATPPMLRPETKETASEGSASIDSVKQEHKPKVNTPELVIDNKKVEQTEPEPVRIEAPVQKPSESFEIIHQDKESSTVENENDAIISTPEQVINADQKESDIEKDKPLESKTDHNDVENIAGQSNKSIEAVSDSTDDSINNGKEENVQPAAEQVVEPVENKDQSEKTIDSDIKGDVSDPDEADDIEIKSENSNNENSEAVANNIETKTVDNNVEEKKIESTVVEKQATVNLKDFEVVRTESPQLEDGDDVVVYQPNNFLTKAEKQLASDSYKMTTKKKVTDNFTAIREKAANNSTPTVENSDQSQSVSLDTKTAGDIQKKSVIESAEQQISEKLSGTTVEKADQEDIIVPELTAAPEVVKQPDNKSSENIADKNLKSEVDADKLQNADLSDFSESNIEKSDTQSKTQKPTKSEKSSVIGSILQSAYTGESEIIPAESISPNPEQNVSEQNTDESVSTEKSKQVKKKDKKKKVKNKDVKVEDIKPVSEDVSDNSDNKNIIQEKSSTKKSWWDKLKFWKKKENIESDKIITEPEQEAQLKPEEVEDSKTTAEPSVVPAQEDVSKENTTLDDVPKIRMDKNEITSEDKKDSVQKEKKKFRWWWQKDQSEVKVKTEQVQESETKTEKDMKFKFKNPFSKKNKNVSNDLSVKISKEKKVIKELQK